MIYSNNEKSAEKQSNFTPPPKTKDWIKFLLKAKSQLAIHKIKYGLPFDTYIDNVRSMTYYYYIVISMDTAANCETTTDIYDGSVHHSITCQHTQLPMCCDNEHRL